MIRIDIVEIFKYRESILAAHKQKIIKEIWEQGYLPNEWVEATLCPIIRIY